MEGSPDPASIPVVVHDVEAGRFEIRQPAGTAVLEYALSGGDIAMFHTGVPPELEGRGLGGKLVKAALDYARGEGLRVIPQCSFVRAYIDRHPEYAPLLDPR